jgi:hypothetical protein
MKSLLLPALSYTQQNNRMNVNEWEAVKAYLKTLYQHFIGVTDHSVQHGWDNNKL